MTDEQRAVALELVRSALTAVDPERSVERALRREGETLRVGERRYALDQIDRVLVVGAGKASVAMARGVERVLGDRLEAGLVLAKAGQVRPPLPLRVEVVEAGHPVPDAAGLRGTRRLCELIRGLGPRDLVCCLVSGGGSSLLTLPCPGVGLEELQQLGALLLGAGVPIDGMNAVRKHLSQLTGGRLAALASPATVLSLILSDVVGSPLEAISSGPTAPDPTTYGQALTVLERSGLLQAVPPAVLAVLHQGAAGGLPETPKAGDPVFARVQNVIVGSNEVAAAAVQQRAEELGLRSLILTTHLQGEAREAGVVLASLLRELALRNRPVARPALLIAGGETTVMLGPGPHGRGGRNQELALAAGISLAGLSDVLLVALATDGNDGPTDAAGALVDGTTVARASAAGLSPIDHLLRHDAYPLFAALGDLLLIGPTGTNVNDLNLLLAF